MCLSPGIFGQPDKTIALSSRFKCFYDRKINLEAFLFEPTYTCQVLIFICVAFVLPELVFLSIFCDKFSAISINPNQQWVFIEVLKDFHPEIVCIKLLTLLPST